MMRLALAGLLTASLVGPWSGCDRDPVGPPAAPPPERAPGNELAPAPVPSTDGILLITDARRLG
jgi:hypothetical protein